VDGIQKFPTRNFDNCINFQGYRGMERAVPGGGKRYCAMCSEREICEGSGFLRDAGRAHNASILLTTPHLETRLTGQDVEMGAACLDIMDHERIEVQIAWQDIARILAAHPEDTCYIEHAHRTPRSITLSIRPDPKGWPIEVWPGEHFFSKTSSEQDALVDDEDAGDEDDEQDALAASAAPVTGHRWSVEGRDLMLHWFIARRHGWGSSRDELALLYQRPTSWDWELMVIDESPLGAMHDTVELSMHGLTQLFAAGQLVAPAGALERLGAHITSYSAGDAQLAASLAELGLVAGIHAATLDAQTMALLERAAAGHTASAAYIERLALLCTERTTLSAEAIEAACGKPPAHLVWDEALLQQHKLLPTARLVERAMRAGWKHAQLHRKGLRIELPSPEQLAWEQLCRLGAPSRIWELARSMPDWRAGQALLATAQASLPFEGCWCQAGALRIPVVKRLDTTQARTTLYLDGTADPLTAAAVAPGCVWHPVVLRRPDDMEVVQIKLCATRSKITESPDQTRRWITAHALAEASWPGQVLHVTHKRTNPAVQDTLSQEELEDRELTRARGLLESLLGERAHDRLLHHGAALGRGSNHWQAARAVCLDAWRVPKHAITERARVLRTLAGAEPEQALDAARFALEGQGVIQEIHRVRPLLGATTVFVLDDRELPGLTPDAIWSTDELDLAVWRLTGHLPYHHTPVTLALIREAVLAQGGLVLGDKLFEIDEAALRRTDAVRKGLSQTFLHKLIADLPPSPLRLARAAQALVQDKLGGAWSKLADAADLMCVKARTSLQNRELLLLMPEDHTGDDALRLLSQVPGMLWYQLDGERVYRMDPAKELRAWLALCTPTLVDRWDLLPGAQARRQLVTVAREHGFEVSHPRLAAAMRLLAMGIEELRQWWRSLHAIDDQQELPWGARARLDELAAQRADARVDTLAQLEAALDPATPPERRRTALMAALIAHEHGVLVEPAELAKTCCLVWQDEQGWHIAGLDAEAAPPSAIIHWGSTPIGLLQWFV
jgi:hypothetical protein